MQAINTHVAGVDVHKEILVITVLVGEAHQEPSAHLLRTSTFTDDLRRCGEKLLELGVTDVPMESTGIYWKPVYNVWHRLGLKITLANAHHLKRVPGRKTDVSDSHWIAILMRNGLIRSSFIPEEEFQQLRALNRHRIYLMRDLTRVKNRVQKVLEDGNIKIGSVLSDVFGVGCLAVLRAIAQGQTAAKALTNCLTEVHCFQIERYLGQFDELEDHVRKLDAEITRRMEKYSQLIERLDEIPGIDIRSAQGIIAEATAHMDAFQHDRNFAAWAGVAPGNNQSARKRRKAPARKGNPTLKGLLVQAAKSAVRKKDSYYQAKHTRLILQTGSKNKATVAIANRIARVIYHLIKDPDRRFTDLTKSRVLSTDYQIKRKIAQLRQLGVEVRLQSDGVVTVKTQPTI